MLAVAVCHLTKNRFRPVIYCYSAALLYIPTYVLLYRLFGTDLSLLGIYLPILVVEPAIVKRMEFSELEPVKEALRHGFNNALGMCIVLLIVGMFLEGGAALIILAPLMVPIVKAAGIDLVHFGIVCNVNIMIGGLTPPFGSMMFTCVSITDCKMQEFIKECVPFIIALLIALLLLTYIPGISMLIPNLIY